jgi:hypothetical protein
VSPAGRDNRAAHEAALPKRKRTECLSRSIGLASSNG